MSESILFVFMHSLEYRIRTIDGILCNQQTTNSIKLWEDLHVVRTQTSTTLTFAVSWQLALWTTRRWIFRGGLAWQYFYFCVHFDDTPHFIFHFSDVIHFFFLIFVNVIFRRILGPSSAVRWVEIAFDRHSESRKDFLRNISNRNISMVLH
jgi:hypothetical protein